MDKRILRFRDGFRHMKDGGVVAPAMATVFPSYGCNFHCPGCHYNAWNEKGWQFIQVDPLLRTLREAADLGLKAVVLSGGGEPLFHRRIRDIVDGILAMGLKLGIITNGERLLRDVPLRDVLFREAEFVRISVYPETKVASTYDLAFHPRRAKVGIKLLVGTHTADFYRQLLEGPMGGAPWDYIEMKAERDSPNDPAQLPDGGAALEADLKALSSKVKGGLRKVPMPAGVPCYLTPVHTVIDAVGDVLLCCFFHGRKAEHAIGNIYGRESFLGIWHGDRHRQARAGIDMAGCARWDCRFFPYLQTAEAVLAGAAVPPSVRSEFDDDELFI